MDDVTLARALHVLAIIFWIGGVGFVTTVLLPAIRRATPPGNRAALFQQMEQSFARQARVTTLVAGLSGLYMVYRLDLWARFAETSYWWMHAMVCVWLAFTLMLFVVEPLGLVDKRLAAHGQRDIESTMRLMQIFHWVLFGASLVTVLGAALGAHGLLLFD